MKKYKRSLFLVLVVAFGFLASTSASAASFLGVDPSSLFSGASDDVKAFGTALLGISIVIAVFGFVFSMVHRR